MLLDAIGADATARADDEEPPAQERWLAGVELGAIYSLADGGRRDVLGLAGIVFRWRRPLSERSALSIGTSIPFTPSFAAQVIVGYERDLTARRKGPVVRGVLRPLLGVVAVCGASGHSLCPLDQAAEPHDRGGWVVGVAAEVGVGWRFGLTPWKRLEVIVSYVGGVFDGRAQNTESALDGYYQGGMLSVDLLF